MHPKIIPLSSYNDVYKNNVQTLLTEEDKTWWNNFREKANTIGPFNVELQEYEDLWEVMEGEVEEDYLEQRRRMRIPTVITVNNYPVTITDVTKHDCLAVYSGRNDYVVVKVIQVHKEVKMLCGRNGRR